MRRSFSTPVVLALGLSLAAVPAAARPLTHPGTAPQRDMGGFAKTKLTTISTDPFTNADSAHQTEVEPDSFAWGNTIVTVFQQGRFYTGGGSSDIGWSTSTDGGAHWKAGSFQGVTKYENSSNPYDRASDTAIAYDAKHGKWIAEILPLKSIKGTETGQQPVVITSNDGLHWGKPINTTPDNGDSLDKPWIVCDNNSSSKHYGNCYIEEDDFSAGEQMYMMTSKNGGKTWTVSEVTGIFGTGGQPLVEPDGVVVVPHADISNGSYETIASFRSTNGGKTWGGDVVAATIYYNPQAGGIRSLLLPGADIDGAGNVYVAWTDCRFRTNCTSDDIVYSVGTKDGKTWGDVQRVPEDSTSSGADHFIPGIAVDPATSGSGAHVAVTYYYYPTGNCYSSDCQLETGYMSSADGGATWTKAKLLAGPMQTFWLAPTNQGYMAGDYISTSYSAGLAHGVFAVASANSGSSFNEPTVTNAAGLAMLGTFGVLSARGDRAMPNAHFRVSAKHIQPPND